METWNRIINAEEKGIGSGERRVLPEMIDGGYLLSCENKEEEKPRSRKKNKNEKRIKKDQKWTRPQGAVSNGCDVIRHCTAMSWREQSDFFFFHGCFHPSTVAGASNMCVLLSIVPFADRLQQDFREGASTRRSTHHRHH